jgi:hypothetical protein
MNNNIINHHQHFASRTYNVCCKLASHKQIQIQSDMKMNAVDVRLTTIAPYLYGDASIAHHSWATIL